MLFQPLLSKTSDSRTPKYEQLYELLREAILDGRISAGDKLPATRDLSQQLGIGRNAVITAFEMLVAEGFLETRHGAGTFVAHLEGLIPVLRRGETSTTVVKTNSLSDAMGRIDAFAAAQSDHRSGTIMLPANPPTALFPHKAWQRCTQQAARQHDYDRADLMGDQLLRQELADYLSLTRGIRCSAEQIMLTSGSLHGIAMALQVLVNPRERVLLEDRGYPGIDGALTGIGASPQIMPCDDHGVLTDHLAAYTARVMVITPSRCFPMGGTLSLERRIALLDWLYQADRWLIEDDYDSEFIFSGHSIAALQSMDRSGRVIYTGTFSRTLFPSIRTGYLVLPEALVEVFNTYRRYTEGGMPTLQQHAMGLFMQQGHYARHLRRMRKHYQTKKAQLLSFMAQHFPNLKPLETTGGMHLVFRLEGDDIAIAAGLNRAGIGARALSSYERAPLADKGIILGYAALEDEHLVRLQHALNGCLAQTTS
ncbi:PLP-dependent aminotransferase family protein [Neptunomonas marina]|uniref:MocR-like pyridoxine biosynthesis transcription factor PdxR n=1 Tax=Neptunomonas marina TaxID=1815562 RepID=UPI0013E3CC6D|nr:PLP-dependent aminotransferase family protein [Neptunomonas marina]